ncbi:MAG: Gfo/Idh/MocA family oxidoreductase [Candidatus Marinimicrobia bacterium]|nr:Gfo/Idh/MocA family oxidoreductase [Candidatus Neomarinimicrobiota bacterium]
MNKIKIGIIGTGNIAKTHGGNLQSIPDVLLGSVFDINTKSSQAFAREFGMTVRNSIEEVFSDSDAVYITVPNKLHAELSLEALAAGKHVFCEKPFALNIGDAEKIVNAVNDAGVIYQLGFNRRFAPVYKKMKDFILGGDLVPVSFNIKMNRGELQTPPWTSNPEITGGFLFESTLHLIDMVCYLFGEVKKVTAVGSKTIYPCVDDFSMIFEMENGIHGVLSSSAHTTWMYPFERVEVYGNHFAISNDEMESVTYCSGLDQPYCQETFSTLPIEKRWGFIQEDSLFIARLLGKQEGDMDLIATHIDGYKNVELIENIYQQIGLGR